MTSPQKAIVSAAVMGALVFMAPVVWLVFQQGVGLASYLQCATARHWGLAAGVVAICGCVGAGFVCWQGRLRGTPTQQFLFRIGAGSACLFGLAALVMMAALALVPSCVR